MPVLRLLRAGGDHGGVASGCCATLKASMWVYTAAEANSKAGGLLEDNKSSHRSGGIYAVRAPHGATDHGLRQVELRGRDLCNTNAANVGWGLPLYRSKVAAAGNDTGVDAYCITSAEVDAKGADGEASARRSGAAKVVGAFYITVKGADGVASARRSGSAKVAGTFSITAKGNAEGADSEAAVRARRSGHPKFAVLWRPSPHFTGVLTASAQSTALFLGGRRCFSSGAGDPGKKEKVKVVLVVISFGPCTHHFYRSELYAHRILGAVKDAERAHSNDMMDMRKENRANLVKHALGVVSAVVIFIFAGGWYGIQLLKTFYREGTDYAKKIPARIAGAAGSYTMGLFTSTWGIIVDVGESTMNTAISFGGSCREGLRAAGDWVIFWRRGKKEPAVKLEKKPVLELEKVPGMELDKVDVDGLLASLEQKKAERKAREQAAEEQLTKIMNVWFVQHWH
ncbi:hypothetical protein EJB05_51611 [Eragrostis curvula]|uniref:Uncharacterized protein n=1 Tax=Eragrostis curvula TaxID=38414 RepID=A0A5J9SV89_9POAL|nr:hypothetical protein EJB05_51611 [Eragrostis curvula]